MSKGNTQIIVFTGGGSGGHSTTAMTVLDKLCQIHPGVLERVVYIVGSLGMEGEEDKPSIEERICKDKGVNHIRIRSGKLHRRLAFSTFLVLLGVIGGIIDAWKFFNNHTVEFVFSTGGYVAVPVCFVAWIKKVPVVIHEQTTRVGLSNRISSVFAKKVLVGFKNSIKYFPKHKTIFVGNPVRKCLLEPINVPLEIARKIKIFKKRSKKYPVVFITGGGQGSHLINVMVRQSLKVLLVNYQIIMITGDNVINRDYDLLSRSIKKLSDEFQSRIILTKYAGEEIGSYFSIADLFVGRGGALFVYEVGVTKTPAIFIPIPWVTHNEQYHNAKILEDLGLASILPQGELSTDILVQRISKMIGRIRSGKLDVDYERLNTLFVTDASMKIVKELENFADL